MSTKEIFAGGARPEEKSGRSFAVILLAVLSAACVFGAAAYERMPSAYRRLPILLRDPRFWGEK